MPAVNEHLTSGSNCSHAQIKLVSEEDVVREAIGERMQGHLRQFATAVKEELDEQPSMLHDDAGHELSSDMGDGCDYATANNEELAAQLFLLFLDSDTTGPIVTHTNSALRRQKKDDHQLHDRNEFLRYQRVAVVCQSPRHIVLTNCLRQMGGHDLAHEPVAS